MTFPLDLFITPMQQFKSDGSGMRLFGEAGDSMQRERLQKMQQQQAEAHFQQQQGLQRDELKSLDRYRNDQIDARKQAIADKNQDAKERRRAVLLDQFKKAKNGSPEQKLIMQELQSLGQAVTEEDTELPEPTPPPPVVSPLDIAPDPTAKGIKGKPPTPGFKKALDAEMQKEDQFGLGGPETEPEEPTPTDFGALGIPPEIAPQKKRGGKFMVRDEKGNLVMSYDAPMEKDKNLSSMKNILGPLVKNARSPEEKAAAQAALDTAMGAMDSGGYTVKEAAERAEKVYKDMMGRYKPERRPGSIPTGVGGGLSKEGRIRLGGLTDDNLAVVNSFTSRHGTPEAHKALGNTANMEDLLSHAHEDGFTGGAALSAYMKEISGTQVAAEEVGRIIGGAGKLNELQFRINQYVDGGKLPLDLIRGLKAVAAARRKVMEDRIQAAGDDAYNYVKKAPGLSQGDEREQSAMAVAQGVAGEGWKPRKEREGAPNVEQTDERKALEKKLQEKYGQKAGGK